MVKVVLGIILVLLITNIILDIVILTKIFKKK